MKSDFEIAYSYLRERRVSDPGLHHIGPEELRDICHELGVCRASMDRAYWRFKMEVAIYKAEDWQDLKEVLLSIVYKVA